jgi:hypothetical protein
MPASQYAIARHCSTDRSPRVRWAKRGNAGQRRRGGRRVHGRGSRLVLALDLVAGLLRLLRVALTHRVRVGLGVARGAGRAACLARRVARRARERRARVGSSEGDTRGRGDRLDLGDGRAGRCAAGLLVCVDHLLGEPGHEVLRVLDLARQALQRAGRMLEAARRLDHPGVLLRCGSAECLRSGTVPGRGSGRRAGQARAGRAQQARRRMGLARGGGEAAGVALRPGQAGLGRGSRARGRGDRRADAGRGHYPAPIEERSVTS